MARVGVVSADPAFVARVRGLGGQVEAQVFDAGSTTDVGRTSALGVMSQRPDTVVVGGGLATDHIVRLTEEIDALHPHVVVIWVVEESEQAWRTAMQAGARDVLTNDASDADIVERIRHALGVVDRRRNQSDLIEVEGGPVRGRVIAIVSPKGGSGKTMLATNVAVGLQERTETGVVLLDLDLQFGDVSSALGLRPEYSVVDAAKSQGDATALKAFLVGHQTGLFTLAAPSNPAEAEDAEPGQIAKLIDTFSTEFGYVVIDTGAGIHETTLTAIEQATDVMFVTTIDVAAIQALRKAVVVLDRLQLNQHKRWYVLNRATSRTGLSRGEIEDVTGLAVDVEIPSNRSVSKSMNQGSPVLIDQRRARVGKSLMAATDLLAPPPGRKAGRGER